VYYCSSYTGSITVLF
nr:immunoglobulin light chain junction region [Macaca mulatta]MOW68512.1 immunoglobulin light chain junction region [Macaca mulatta]MOW72389.1 immunoglobulin light chain junction region [Macaca mulatta]